MSSSPGAGWGKWSLACRNAKGDKGWKPTSALGYGELPEPLSHTKSVCCGCLTKLLGALVEVAAGEKR